MEVPSTKEESGSTASGSWVFGVVILRIVKIEKIRGDERWQDRIEIRRTAEEKGGSGRIRKNQSNTFRFINEPKSAVKRPTRRK